MTRVGYYVDTRSWTLIFAALVLLLGAKWGLLPLYEVAIVGLVVLAVLNHALVLAVQVRVAYDRLTSPSRDWIETAARALKKLDKGL